MNVAIGKQIKALRKNKGVSQEAVADYLNISQSAYSRIENGNSHSWACYIEKICIYFEIEPKHLVAPIIVVKDQKNKWGGGKSLITNTIQNSVCYEIISQQRENLFI